MYPHLRRHGTALYNTAIAGDITKQERQAAGGGIGLVQRADDLGIAVVRVGDIFPHGIAGDGRQLRVQQPRVRQLLHDGRHAAGLVQFLRRCQMAQVGSFLADFIELLQIDGQPRLVGDGRDMQGCVGGTAQRHIYGDGIMKRFCRYDVPGTDVFLHQLHDLHAGVLGELDAGGDGSGDTAVARQRHAQRFAQTVHGVGREHAGTGTAGGAGGLLTLPKARIVQLARLIGAHCLEHLGQAGLLSADMTRQHGASGAYQRRDVHADGSHQHTGHDLVAVGDQHRAVEAMGGQQCLH